MLNHNQNKTKVASHQVLTSLYFILIFFLGGGGCEQMISPPHKHDVLKNKKASKRVSECTKWHSQSAASYQVLYCPPPFRRKAEGHSFRHSVLPSFRPSFRLSVLPSFRPPNIVGTLCAQLLLQFYADSFETLQMFLSWSEDMHVVLILS